MTVKTLYDKLEIIENSFLGVEELREIALRLEGMRILLWGLNSNTEIDITKIKKEIKAELSHLRFLDILDTDKYFKIRQYINKNLQEVA